MSERRRGAIGWRGSQSLLFTLALIAILSYLSGCGSGQPDTGQTNNVPVSLSISMPEKSASAASASTRGSRFLATIQSWLPSLTSAWAATTADLRVLTVEVTGPGIPSPTPITKRVDIPQLPPPSRGQVITIDLDVPVGLDRVFTVSGLEEKGSSIFRGQSSPTPLVAGQPATVDIALVALPFVTSVLPANSATDVAPSSQIQITFSKPMDANTITSETFKLQNSTGGVLGSRVSCNTPCTIATLTPLSPLDFGTSFTVVLGQGITDTTVPPLTLIFTGAVPFPTTFTTSRSTPPPPFGMVTGTVTNATNGSAIQSASVRIVNTNLQTSTDTNGNFTINAVPEGRQTVEASATNFITNSVPVDVAGGGTRTVSISLRKIIATDQISIILNWSPTPRDLDAHLLVPSTPPFEIVYFNKGRLDASPFAQLDHDITTGGGPETITISAPIAVPPPRFAGTYCYFVRNFSGEAPLTSSGASVQVLDSNIEIARFTVPTTGTGRNWEIFHLDGETGTITPVQGNNGRITNTACQ